MRRRLLYGLAAMVAAAALGGYYRARSTAAPPEITTAPVTRGDIVESVGATGTLEAVTTVQVGTQVSGTIQQLSADFNSIVKKGQVIARLEPSLFQTQIEQARANLVRSQAEVERWRVTLDDFRTKLARAEELFGRALIPRNELETAQVNVRSAEAQLRSAQAQVTQAQASLNQNEVNLRHTVIVAPIDGIVISRNVDVGQTVAASMQAPTLFVIAADLTKMKVNASIDEADVGRMRPGQPVRFRVDAFPTDEFAGTVSQVRLQPAVVQNVVTYTTVIDVPNADLKLKPGMTANVTIEVARRDDVIRVPNTALRFRPTPEIFAALQQEPPGDEQRVDRRGQGRKPTGTTGSDDSGGDRFLGPAGTAGEDPQVAGGQDPQRGRRRGLDLTGEAGPPMDPAERRRRMLERLQALPPEQREQLLRRLRERGIDPGSEGRMPPAAAEGAGAARRGPETAEPEPPARSGRPAAPRSSATAAGAQTIDSLFGALPVPESSGRVWLYRDGRLEPLPVRLGLSDGTNTELVAGSLEPGEPLVTAVLLDQPAAATPAGRSPLMPGRGPGGGRGAPPGVRNAP